MNIELLEIFEKFLNFKIKFFKTVLSGNKLGNYPRITQPCLFLGQGQINIDNQAQLGYYPSPFYFNTYSHIEARNVTSQIIIKKNTFINNNSSIISNGAKIEIGENCRIGANFQCYDSDFHGQNVEDRDNPSAITNLDVNIGNNVFIGNNVMILKGVRIGDGSIVGAGSVVTKSFPEKSIIGGNPAKFIKEIA